jgi:hypothetical protein
VRWCDSDQVQSVYVSIELAYSQDELPKDVRKMCEREKNQDERRLFIEKFIVCFKAPTTFYLNWEGTLWAPPPLLQEYKVQQLGRNEDSVAKFRLKSQLLLEEVT